MSKSSLIDIILSPIVLMILLPIAFYYLFPRVFEGFKPNTKKDQPCPPNSVKCPSGDCKLFSDIYGMC